MRQEISRYVKMWETRCYSEGIPDEAPREIDDMVPSYRRIAMAILKNDLGYIGISPPESKYYGILKAIELNKPYKPKRMTQSELKESVFTLINTMIAHGCYVKGYGNMYRVCDSTHSPVKNITKDQMRVLEFNSIVIRAGLIWTLNVLANPFSHQVDVKLPAKYE